MHLRIFICFCFCLFVSFKGFGQQYFYFIGFKDKPNADAILQDPGRYLSAKAIERRARNQVPLNVNDIPPDSGYLRKLSSFPLHIHGVSRWFNGCVVLVSEKETAEKLSQLEFVANVKYLGPAPFYEENQNATEQSIDNHLSILEQSFEAKKEKIDSQASGKSYKQLSMIGSDSLLKLGLNGKGVMIAVLDAGFLNLDKLPAFRPLFAESRIISSWDFIEYEEDVFDDDEHGLAVMSCLGAYQPGIVMGSAPGANYLLLRTENASSEYLSEEYFWAIAAEYADSCGADIINSSLGYTKHDDKSMGHKFNELDGKTTLITRAAEIASSKGILVIASAGNEGNESWRQISAPADGFNVVSVGAVDKQGRYVGFSSVGPTADKRIKPDLVAMGKGVTLLSDKGRPYEGNGTSYACPIIAGAFAQLMQANPVMATEKIKSVVFVTGNNTIKPDKYIGKGLPNMVLAHNLLRVSVDSIAYAYNNTDNNSIELIIYSRSKQSILLTLTDAQNQVVYQKTLHLNRGLTHPTVKLNKKRPAGVYRLSAQFQGKNQELIISFP